MTDWTTLPPDEAVDAEMGPAATVDFLITLMHMPPKTLVRVLVGVNDDTGEDHVIMTLPDKALAMTAAEARNLATFLTESGAFREDGARSIAAHLLEGADMIERVLS